MILKMPIKQLLQQKIQLGVAFTLSLGVLLAIAPQAMAHHPFGGRTPGNLLEGIVSGVGHPIIGLDHLAFVVASGLLATGLAFGIFIPVGFVLGTIAGTVIHLLAVDLPAVEVVIATSVVAFGALLAMGYKQDNGSSSLNLGLAALGAIAGVFHGYAYGETVVGAEMTPIVAYLTGFATTQLMIALGALLFGKIIQKKGPTLPIMRFLGLAIAAIGMVFLSSSFGA